MKDAVHLDNIGLQKVEVVVEEIHYYYHKKRSMIEVLAYSNFVDHSMQVMQVFDSYMNSVHLVAADWANRIVLVVEYAQVHLVETYLLAVVAQKMLMTLMDVSD